MADSSQGGGGGLLGIDPNLLAQLGLGLISSGAKNSPLRGNWGMGLMQGEQNYQQMRAANQDNQMRQLQMGLTKAQFQAEMPMYQAAGEMMHRWNNDPTTPMKVQGLLGGLGGTQGAAPMPQNAPPASGLPPPQNAAPGAPPLPPMGGAAQPSPQQQQPPSAPNRYRPPAPLPTVGGDPMRDVQMGTAFSMMPQFKGLSDALINRPKNLQAAQESLIKQRQQELAEPMATLDTVAGAANADAIVKNDPELMARWQELAPRLGLNPQSSLTPDNARAFARYGYNELAGSAQQSPKPMPDIYDTYPGQNGQLLQKSRLTGKIEEPIPQKLPTYSLEKSWDPVTQRNVGTMVQTSPGGAAAPAGIFGGAPGNAPRGPSSPQRSAGQQLAVPGRTATGAVTPSPAASPGAPASGTVGGTIPGKIDLGYTAPTSDNVKSVGFAASLRSGLQTVRGLERQGIAPTPMQRAQIIKVASGDDSGYFQLWAQQEALKHNFDANMQSYLAGMMPVIQAVSHDQSGARLNESQIKSNLETVIPVDVGNKNALAQINSSRDGFYHQSLIGAGAAIHSPAFEGTLGADQRALSLPTKNAQGWTLHRDANNRYAYVSPDGKQHVIAQ